MILAIDVGNTSTTLGIYENNNMETNQVFRLDTYEEDENVIKDILISNGVILRELSDIIICSVVPNYTAKLKIFFEKHVGISPYIVDNTVYDKFDLNLLLDKKNLGSDIFVGCVKATSLFKPPLIVFDIGTALTACVIDKNKNILGGIIFPGPVLAASILSEKCACIPNFEIKEPVSILGKNTEDAIGSGIFFGYSLLIDGFIDKIEKSISDKCCVVITGGYAEKLVEKCKHDDIKVCNNLLTDGLAEIYNKLKN